MKNVSTAPDVGQPSDPHALPPARPDDAPLGSTAPTPGEDPDAPADEHTRATVIPGEGPPPRLDFADPIAVRRWLNDLAARVDDLAAAAEDQTAPMDERMLGPAKARQLIGDAYGSLRALVALARAGLTPGGAR
jgi:hypothetical protein